MINLRNIGIFASVDAGKTTLTEQMLYKSGTIKNLGSVDNGTTQTDNLSVERNRGISVQAYLSHLTWNNIDINIIDTPGHVDFSSQVEKSMWALDGAILLLSSCDEISGYAKRIYQTLIMLKKPTIIFINKSDRALANIDKTINNIESNLSSDIVILNKAFFQNTDTKTPHPIYEKLAGLDDNILEKYINEDSLPKKLAADIILSKTHDSRLSPVLIGSALTGENVDLLMDLICSILPPPKAESSTELCGIIFGIKHDDSMGKGAYVRLFSGSIKIRQNIKIADKDYKITQIRKLNKLKLSDCNSIESGEIAIIYGLSDSKVSDIIGNKGLLPKIAKKGQLQVPLLQADIQLLDDSQLPLLKKALSQLSDEDPSFEVMWSSANQKYSIKIMGMIQIEVLENILYERFSISAKINPPEVIYKETPSKKGYGYDAYTMPKPCWAVLHFKITPNPRGTGVTYSCEVTDNQISHRYLKQVESTIPRALKQGIHGWEVTDIHIALIDGEDHLVHTHPLDFVVATPLAIMDGLSKTGTDLLEPILEVDFILPIEFGGKVMNDITLMRGKFEVHNSDDSINIKAIIPTATSWDYSLKLASITSGKGMMISKFLGYKKCPLNLGKTTPRRSVNPLDRSKYILAARNALNGKIFDD